MTPLQKSLVGLILVAAIGVAVYQTREVSQLSGQLQAMKPLTQEARTSQTENTDSTPNRERTRVGTTEKGRKLTPAQFEAKLLSLSKIGIAKFGWDNMNRLIADASLDDIRRMLPLVDKQLPNALRRCFHDVWLERWATADAPAAFAYAVGIDDNDCTSEIDLENLDLLTPALDNVLRNWAGKDLAGAIKALDAYTGPNREEACAVLAGVWVETDPKAATNWAMAAMRDDTNTWALDTRNLAKRWAETDPTAAWIWVNALPNIPAKSLFISDLAPLMTDISPAAIANSVSKMVPGDAQNWAAMSVAQDWGRTDPRAAAEWALQFPDENSRLSALFAIGRDWADKDPAAARDWVQSLPAGPDQQQALWGVIEKLTTRHPEQAADLVKYMTNPDTRVGAMMEIGLHWIKTDPATGRQWLQSNGLQIDDEE